VGRTCIEGGLFNFRPLYVPPITLMIFLTGLRRLQDYQTKHWGGQCWKAKVPLLILSL